MWSPRGTPSKNFGPVAVPVPNRERFSPWQEPQEPCPGSSVPRTLIPWNLHYSEQAGRLCAHSRCPYTIATRLNRVAARKACRPRAASLGTDVARDAPRMGGRAVGTSTCADRRLCMGGSRKGQIYIQETVSQITPVFVNVPFGWNTTSDSTRFAV